jgi:WD40 repeat protein
VAGAHVDGSLEMWSLSGVRLPFAAPHGDRVTALDWAPDGGSLISASLDGTVRVLRAPSQRLLAWHEVDANPIVDVSFSSDGSMLAASMEGRVTLLALDGTRRVIETGYRLTTARLSPDGARILVSAEHRRPTLFDAVAAAPVAELDHMEAIYAGFLADDRSVVTSDLQETRLWRGAERVATIPIAITSPPAPSPDGSFVLAGAGRLEVRESGGTLRGPLDRRSDVIALASGRTGIVGAFGDRDLVAWGADGRVSTHFTGAPTFANDVTISPDGALVAAVLDGGETCIWDIEGGAVVSCFAVDTRNAIVAAFSRDSTRLAVGGKDGVVTVWSVARAAGDRRSIVLGVERILRGR